MNMEKTKNQNNSTFKSASAIILGITLFEFGQRIPNELALFLVGNAKLPDGSFNEFFLMLQMPGYFLLFSLTGFLMLAIIQRISLVVLGIVFIEKVLASFVLYFCGIAPIWYIGLHLCLVLMGLFFGTYLYKKYKNIV